MKAIKYRKKTFYPSPEMTDGFSKKADFVKFWWEDSFFKWFAEKDRKVALNKLWDNCKKEKPDAPAN